MPIRWSFTPQPGTLNPFFGAVRSPIVLVTAATALLFVALWWWLPAPFTLTIPIQTSRAVHLKLYYAGGDSGFREDRQSVRFADSRSAFKPVRLSIPRSNLRALRLHVSPGAVVDFGRVVLSRIGRSDIAIDPSHITIVNSSCKMEQMGAITRFQTAADSDGFDLDLHSPEFPLSNARRLEPSAVVLLCCLLATLVWFSGRRPTTAQVLTRLQNRRLNPRTCRRVVTGLALVFALATVLKINGSSSAIWRFEADGRLPDDGVLLGGVKDIRSDEWMVQTPWILSQVANDPPFATTNPNVGDQATGLLVNLPIRHWTTIFRPQFWSFFVLDVEHAFAWYWNLKWFVVIVGGFLFFRLITSANAVATVAGTALTFFAPYIQWWYSTGAALPEMLGMTFIGLWALHQLLRAKSSRAIAGAAVLLVVAIENFIFCCYPRFQIPLLYFAALVALWFFFRSPPRRNLRIVRWCCLAAVFALVGWCGLLWYGEVASTFQMTAQLEYPGRVFSVGGDFPWVQFLVPYLQLGMTEFHYPIGLVNACNAAGFVLVLPFIALLWITSGKLKRDLLVFLMLGFVAAVGYFMMVGIPAGLAKYSGWSLVYSTRGILPAGIALLVCFVRLLARRPATAITNSWIAAVAAVVFTVAAWFCLSAVNARYEKFVSPWILFAASAYLAVIGVMFLSDRRAVATALLLTPIFAEGVLVNPIVRGLPGFYRSETFQWLQSFTKDHAARWIVVGNGSRASYLPYLVKAAGGDVLGGIRCNPDMRVFSVLDPEKQHFNVWNRFAIVSYQPSKNDKVDLTLTSGVSYTVSIPFKPDVLDRLAVHYLLTADAPATDPEIQGFHRIAERDGLVLRVRDAP
jgi:hypothetical protein